MSPGWKWKNTRIHTRLTERGDPSGEGLNEVMDFYSRRLYYDVFMEMIE